WDYEFLRKHGEAARRVRWLVELYGGGGYCNTRRRTCLIASGRQPKGWRLAIEFWRDSRENLDPSTVAKAFDEFFCGRWILYGKLNHGFSVCDFGDNHAEHVKKWLRAHCGTEIPERSDNVFSQSCARVYRSATETFEPRADETDVIAHWIGYGQRRGQFRRLVLPFKFLDRACVLS